MLFPIALHTDNGIKYGVTVPDLPGCFSGGEDLEDAINSAKEAICLHLESLLEENIPIPAIKNIAEHRKDELLADALWGLVEVDPNSIAVNKHKKINITVPLYTLQKIDKYAKEHNYNRSKLLVAATEQFINNN